MGAAVVQARNTTEAFLSCGIPDLEAHDGVGGAVENAFGDEGRADRGGGSGWVKGIFDVAIYEGCFPDAWNGNIY